MLKFFFGSLALALAASAFAEIDVVHDRFDGTTTIRTHYKGSTEGLSLSLLGLPSSGQKKQPTIFITLSGAFESWRYLDCYHVKWLVDGRPFSLPDTTHEGSVLQYGVHEYISITPVTMAQIERLARAKKVEWKVCNDEYTATEEELQDLRTFLIKMRDPSSVLSGHKVIELQETGGSLGKSPLPNSMAIEEKLQELDRRYRNALLLSEEYQRKRAELLEQQRNTPSSIPAVPANTSATETAPPQAASVVSVIAIELGNQIGADKRITRPKISFAPEDTLYATVVTTGSAPSAILTAKWTYQDGQLVNESTQTITPTGPAATEFHLTKPDGWPAGTYKVEVFLNGRSTGTKEFEVKRY